MQTMDTLEMIYRCLTRCWWAVFTKDPHILSYNLEKNNIDSSLIKLSRTKNEIIVKDLFYKIKKILK